MKKHVVLSFYLALMFLPSCLEAAGVVTGNLVLWYPVTVTFDGPSANESPGTFRNNRLDVTFSKGSKSVKVAGFFAADGDAANTSSTSGNKWRVRFTPDESGDWSYKVSFRTGADIAASSDPAVGTPGPMDGETGTFTIKPGDPKAPGFYSKGILQYVGEHYRRFSGSKEWFIKGGPGSPENLFGYVEFDGTVDKGGTCPSLATATKLHEFPSHVKDWRDGDPTWKGGKGKAIIGLMNYIASTGNNVAYMIPMNVGGDAKDSWPWVTDADRDVYDVSKLEQWDIVLRHMDAVGVAQDYYLAEAENTKLLDVTGDGTLRRIYHREIIGRFGYLLGIKWSLSEETTLSVPASIKALENMATYEVHGHPIGTHTFPDGRDEHYGAQLGNKSISGAWGQIHSNFYGEIKKWVDASAKAGRKWIVSNDEATATGLKDVAKTRDIWWSTVMAGGEGYNAYFGYTPGHGDCDEEDLHTRDGVWKVMGYGIKLFHSPYVNRHLGRNGGMVAANTLGTGDILANENVPGDAAYIIRGAGGSLNMSKATGDYDVLWFNIDNGEFKEGAVKKVTGGKTNDLGSAPGAGTWAIVVAKPPQPVAIREKAQSQKNGNIRFSALPMADGRIAVTYHLAAAAEVSVELFSLRGVKLAVMSGSRQMPAGSHSLIWKESALPRGQYLVRLVVGNGDKVQSLSGNLILLD